VSQWLQCATIDVSSSKAEFDFFNFLKKSERYFVNFLETNKIVKL